MRLPYFTYHPDPIGTGSIEKSNKVCESCEQLRGYIYTGSFYSKQIVNHICPWCIDSGFAAKKFDGSFVAQLDSDPILDSEETKASVLGSFLAKLGVSLSNKGDQARKSFSEELFSRTPGFSSYQEEVWLSH